MAWDDHNKWKRVDFRFPLPESRWRFRYFEETARKRCHHARIPSVVNHGLLATNVMLWRDKKMSAGIFIGATVTWVLLELVGYHLLTLVCNGLLISLAILFLWSKATAVINKSPPHVPEVSIPENQAVKIALEVRCVTNRTFSLVREIALGRDLKKFLAVIVGFYFLSIVGKFVNFLSMLYILFVTLHTMPILYEKYENKIDSFAEKAMVELKKAVCYV